MDVDAALAAALPLVLEFEGFYSYPYDDLNPRAGRVTRANQGRVKGTVTIGYGETNPATLAPYLDDPSAEMTEPEALALVRRRLVEHWEPSRRWLTTELNPNQLAAWISIAYNAGPAGLARWAPETLRAINERRFDDAAELIKTSVTRDQSGRVSAGLVRRRAREAALFATPYTGPAPADRKDHGMFIAGFDGKAWLCDAGTRTPILTPDELSRYKAAGIPDVGDSPSIEAMDDVNMGIRVRIDFDDPALKVQVVRTEG